jgi:hypothetical protein
VKVGPFLIKDQKGPVTYTLDLPSDAKIYPRFHVSLLEPEDPATPLQSIFRYEIENEDEFEVERIFMHRDTSNSTEYLVKWKEYCERSVGAVFQLPSPATIYSQNEGNERWWSPSLAVCVRARSTCC